MGKIRNGSALKRLGLTLLSLAGAVALLAGVGLSGAGLVRAQRGARAEELLEKRYGEHFTVDRVYGRSNVAGFAFWPFILLEEYYTVAAHSDAYPEMLVRADVNVKDDGFWDNYAAQRISRNTEAYLEQEVLGELPKDGAWYFNVGIADAVGYGRPRKDGDADVSDPEEGSGDPGSGETPAESGPGETSAADAGGAGNFRSVTGLALHELEAEVVTPTAAIYYSPASGTADEDTLFDAADRILDYFISCAPGDNAAVTIYLITKRTGVERVRSYLTGNRIGDYSTLAFFGVMEPAVTATLKYSAKDGTRTTREAFVFEPLYPGMPGDTVKVE